MSTQINDLNAVKSAFRSFCSDYRLYIFYIYPEWHVFMHLHKDNFCIFMKNFTLQSIVLKWSFLLYLKSTSCAWKEVWCTNDYCTFRRNNYHLSSFDWHHRKLFVWSIQMIKRRPPQSFGRLWGFLMYKQHRTFRYF